MKHNSLFAATLAALLAAAAAPNGNAQSTPAIPGYTMGQKSLAKAPFTLADLESLKKTLLFTDEDIRYLRMRDRKSTRLNSSHSTLSRMPSSA